MKPAALPNVRSQALAPGGAVLAVAGDGQGRFVLAGEGGLWRGAPGAWEPLGIAPIARANAVLALPDGLLVAGGAPAAIVYSLDGGASWYQASIDAVEEPISCLVASPAFATDRTLLAGTAGAGILRSTDGGRSWRLSNAGLHEFELLALAVAPAWDEHEVAFALTIGGLYQSPNGGRYWRRVADCGDELAMQALAVSPSFAADGRAIAAGELAGLFASDDGGRSWHFGPGPEGVNCLLARPGALLAGTLDGRLLRSAGATWEPVAEGYSSVLALAESDGIIVAGLADEGLLYAHDGGAHWSVDGSLAVRDLTRLAVAHDGAPIAYGPTGGVWRGEGTGWRRIAEPDAPVTALLPLADGSLLLATAETLAYLPDASASAAPAQTQPLLRTEPLPSGAPVTALAIGGELWVGDAAGGVCWQTPGGRWSPAATIGARLAVLALADHGASLVAATARQSTKGGALWRSADGGATWRLWLEDHAPAARACLLAGEPAWAALGTKLWHWDGAAWSADEPDGEQVIALRRAPDGGIVVATAGAVFRRAEHGWQPIALELPPGGLLDLVVLPSGALLGLGQGGRLVTRRNH